MTRFVGRERELRDLERVLDRVRHPTSDRPGAAVALRGRRRVGKSRLVPEFVANARVPAFYFVADGARPDVERARFVRAIATAELPLAASLPETASTSSWHDALNLLALVVPRDRPSVIVLDEVSYLSGNDTGFEGALQAVWDTQLSLLPVMLILIGSNQSEMERLTSHGRPFYGRSTDREIQPLHPRAVAELTGLAAADALDAYLVTGGLPALVTSWRPGQSVQDFLADGLSSSLSGLVASGERVLTSEFPAEVMAKDVLRAIGSDARTFTAIGQAASVEQPVTLTRSLDLLVERRIVAVDEPLSTKASRLKQYRIADPYMRFWLAFCTDAADLIDAGRGDVVVARVERGWSSWRGRAIEPVIRRLLAESAMGADGPFPPAAVVGNWWDRTGANEVDIVGADRSAPARAVAFVGSIKWRDNAPFGRRDAVALARHRDVVPGAGEATPMIAVSRCGGTADETRVLTPGDLL
jgi:AAA+ ATPase superfamily predicted ATPase